MNRFPFKVACAGLMLVLGAGALAQGPVIARKPHAQRHPNRGMHMAVAHIPVAGLAAFVPLKDDQKTRIAAIQDKLKTDLAATRHPGTPPTPADQTQRRQLNEKAAADIEAVLTPEQRNELQSSLPMLEMLRASRAVPLAALPQLNLTQDQVGKLRAAAQQTEEKVRAMPPAERQTQRPALMQEFQTNVQSILTPQQKEILANFHPKHPRKHGVGERKSE
ncbi:MAG TPA: hypothetical protein VFA07_09205 [Chthonomonadaceae bacterium]|nr:hypothetical protein [Chthonomonadaceae bacterium]